MEEGGTESDEASIAALQAAAACTDGAVQLASALEGVIVLRIAQKQILDGSLRKLMGKSADKATKRKR